MYWCHKRSLRLCKKKAALKNKAEKLMTIESARAYSKKLIKEWATGK
jgi:hypothetical protein